MQLAGHTNPNQSPDSSSSSSLDHRPYTYAHSNMTVWAIEHPPSHRSLASHRVNGGPQKDVRWMGDATTGRYESIDRDPWGHMGWRASLDGGTPTSVAQRVQYKNEFSAYSTPIGLKHDHRQSNDSMYPRSLPQLQSKNIYRTTEPSASSPVTPRMSDSMPMLPPLSTFGFPRPGHYTVAHDFLEQDPQHNPAPANFESKFFTLPQPKPSWPCYGTHDPAYRPHDLHNPARRCSDDAPQPILPGIRSLLLTPPIEITPRPQSVSTPSPYTSPTNPPPPLPVLAPAQPDLVTTSAPLSPQTKFYPDAHELDHSGDSDSDQHAAAQSQKLKCPQPGCRKTFTRRYNLQSHLMVHSGLRPYSCEFCGAAFSRQHDLRRHVRSLHLEVRPHQCVYCPLSFARSDALKRHLISEGKRDPATHPPPTS